MAVAIYARQSVDKKDSISIETQIELCRGCCDTNDDILVYTDKGYSGSNTERPGLKEMMRNIQAGIINKVVVYKLDRISRSLPDFVRMMEEFDKKQCDFVSRSEAFDTSTPLGKAMIQICMIFAQLERENTIQRVRDAYSSRSKEGFYMGGRVPYGFKLKSTKINGKQTSMYEPVPEEVEQLKLIFELYSQPDMTLSGVVKKLVSDGIQHLRGSNWCTARLSDLIRNPVYVKSSAEVYRFFKNNDSDIIDSIEAFNGRGCYMYGKRSNGRKFSNIKGQTLVLALHEGVIEPDIWLKCQYKLVRNKQIKRSGLGRNTWLSGLVRCGKCGNSMKLIKAKTRAGRYFNCSGRTELHICEGHKNTIYADVIEELVAAEITEKLSENEFSVSDDKSVRNKQVNELNIKLSEIEAEISKLLDKIADSNEALFRYINDRITELDADKKEIQRTIAELKISSDEKNVLELAEIWNGNNFDAKKLIAQTLIKEVQLIDNEINIIWKI